MVDNIYHVYTCIYSCSEISSLSAIMVFVPSSITVRLRGSYGVFIFFPYLVHTVVVKKNEHIYVRVTVETVC